MKSAWKYGLVVLVCIWVGLLAFLGDDPPRPSTREADRIAAPSPASDAPASRPWTVSHVTSHGNRVGETRERILATPNGARVEQESTLRLTLLGRPQEVVTRTAADVDAQGAVLSMTFQLDSPSGKVRADVRHEGETLHLTLDGGGRSSQRQIRVAGPVHLPVMLRRRLATQLHPGATLEGQVFDALQGGVVPLTLRVVGPSERAGVWLVEETVRELTTRLWLRADGTVERESGPLGLETQRVDGEQPATAESFLDVESLTAMAVGSIADPRQRPELRLRVAGVDREQIPQSPRQRWVGDVLQVERFDLESAPCVPIDGQEEAGAAWLAPEIGVQSDEPRLRQLAQRVVDGRRDVLEATRALVDWVYTYLEKEGTVSVPDALATLDAGRGDCNEHAILLVALLRAAGVAARPIAGVVYVDGKFVYHAWVEVWLGGTWMAVDPALGQVPADATHVTLAYGIYDEAARLLGLAGRMQLSPVP